MSNFDFTDLSNVKIIIAASEYFQKNHIGNSESHKKFAERCMLNEFEAFNQIISTMNLIKNAEKNISTKDTVLDCYSAQIGLAKQLVNLFMQDIVCQLLNTLLEIFIDKAESTNLSTINFSQFQEIANAGKKEWDDNEAILAAAEYLCADSPPRIHDKWIKDWVAKEKLIPTLRNFWNRN